MSQLPSTPLLSGQQQDFGPRVKGALIVKPIVYGNVARYFGQKRNNGHTHQWKVYIRLFNHEDSRGYIKKVQFKLHDSYANPVRICTEPPYEVEETGWGEFDVIIKIYFADPAERPVNFFHSLKLFKMDGHTPVFTDYLVQEHYDELIFAEPSTMMYRLLQQAPRLPASIAGYEMNFEEKRRETLDEILAGKKKIASEIDDLKRKIQVAKDEIGIYKSKLAIKQHQSSTLTNIAADIPETSAIGSISIAP